MKIYKANAIVALWLFISGLVGLGCQTEPGIRSYTTGPKHELDLKDSKSFCSYPGAVPRVMEAAFSQQFGRQTVQDIIKLSQSDSQLDNKSMRIEVYIRNYMNNALANLLPGGRRTIIYDGVWFSNMNRQFSPWAPKGILAHEVGHHHHWSDYGQIEPSIFTEMTSSLAGGNQRWQRELESDAYAGYVLARMRADKTKAKHMMDAMEAMGGASGSQSHPPTQRRRKALHSGWKRGGGQGYSEREDWCPCGCHEKRGGGDRYDPNYDQQPDDYLNEDQIYRRRRPPPVLQPRPEPQYRMMPVPCQHPHPLNPFYRLHPFDLMPVLAGGPGGWR